MVFVSWDDEIPRQLGWWNSQLNGKIKHVCQACLWFYDVLLLKNDDWLVVSIPLRYSTIHIKLLVGGAITILKNMSSSMGRIIPYIMGPWLVVDLPLWKIWKSVGIIIPNIWKNKTCLKPPTYGSTTLWLLCYKKLWKINTIEIVKFPMKNGDYP